MRGAFSKCSLFVIKVFFVKAKADIFVLFMNLLPAIIFPWQERKSLMIHDAVLRTQFMFAGMSTTGCQLTNAAVSIVSTYSIVSSDQIYLFILLRRHTEAWGSNLLWWIWNHNLRLEQRRWDFQWLSLLCKEAKSKSCQRV